MLSMGGSLAPTVTGRIIDHCVTAQDATVDLRCTAEYALGHNAGRTRFSTAKAHRDDDLASTTRSRVRFSAPEAAVFRGQARAIKRQRDPAEGVKQLSDRLRAPACASCTAASAPLKLSRACSRTALASLHTMHLRECDGASLAPRDVGGAPFQSVDAPEGIS